MFLKKAFTLVLLLLILSCASIDTKEIESLEDQWMEALVKKDTAFISGILDEEFVLNGSSSINETRTQYLATSAMAGRELEPLLLSNREYSIHGHTVISTGSTVYNGQWQGNQFSLPVRYTHVWMKKDGNLKVISAHLSVQD